MTKFWLTGCSEKCYATLGSGLALRASNELENTHDDIKEIKLQTGLTAE